METTKDFKNDLLKRQEISLSLEADNNPNFTDIKKQIAEQFKKSEDVIDVYNIKGSFGSNEFKIDAYIYDSKDDLEKAEQKTKKQLEAEKEAEKKASEESQEKPEESAEKTEEKPKDKENIIEKAEEKIKEVVEEVKEKVEEVVDNLTEDKEESKE